MTTLGGAGGLRSGAWWESDGIDGFLHRTAIKVQGYQEEDFIGRPIIGICNNWSELTRCHLHFPAMIDAIKQGVWQAGGFPREFNTMTMGADLAGPTGVSFMHRNLLAMEVEQTVRAYPIDGLVLLGACDETIPAMLMAAAALDLPAIVLPGGPGLNGKWRGEDVGSSTDCHRLLAEFRAGTISADDWRGLESQIERSPGHCTTMGTASTMACLAEALGMAPIGSAALPAADSRRLTLAHSVGRRAVTMVRDQVRPSTILTQAAFENSIRSLAALGGSTNAIIHLLAIAGRLEVDVSLRLFDRLSHDTPLLVNLKPSGKYLMEDFFYAGGMPALLHELQPLLQVELPTAMGPSLGELVRQHASENAEIVAPLSKPLSDEGGIVVLFGNLAPDGAVLKRSAASAGLLQHSGRAVVFADQDDVEARVDSPELDVSDDDILVLRNAGPKGAPGMPEWGNIPIPKKLLERGVRDMVRISDSRMSGTAFGTVILHVAPEAVAGGPIALVRTGDPIHVDVNRRQVDVGVDPRELERRTSEISARTGGRTHRKGLSGYERLYVEHVLQANEGCDFDFLKRSGG